MARPVTSRPPSIRRIRSGFLALAILLAAAGASFAETPTVTVELIGFEFVPREVTIAPGTAVRWVDTDGMFHSVSNGTGSDDPNAFLLFNEVLASPGQEFVFTFAAAGEYPYFCLFHEALDMKGRVTVGPATATDATTWGKIKATSGF